MGIIDIVGAEKIGVLEEKADGSSGPRSQSAPLSSDHWLCGLL